MLVDLQLSSPFAASAFAWAKFKCEAFAADAWPGLVQWLHRYVAYVGTKKALIEGLNRDPGSSGVFLQCRTLLYAAGRPLFVRSR